MYTTPLFALMLLAGTADAQEPPKAGSPVQVTVDQLEDNADRYNGQRIRVRGEVEEVYGPHLFAIDERNWVDFDSEPLIFVPAPLAALVKTNAPVIITGTVRTMSETEIDQDKGLFGDDAQVRVELRTRPVVVADSIVQQTDNANLALRIDMENATAPSGAQIATDLNELAKNDNEQMVGRWVEAKTAPVVAVNKDGSFFVDVAGERLLVVPATPHRLAVGENVELSGLVLEIPAGMKARMANKEAAGEQIYLYAVRLARPS